MGACKETLRKPLTHTMCHTYLDARVAVVVRRYNQTTLEWGSRPSSEADRTRARPALFHGARPFAHRSSAIAADP